MDRENFLAQFSSAATRMIADNEEAYKSGYFNTKYRKHKTYTRKEIEQILTSGNIDSLIQLSKNYFYSNGFYKRLVLHYASLLKYVGILIPNPISNKSLSDAAIFKKYTNALDFIEKADVKNICFNFALKALTEGAYYGILVKNGKSFSIIELPTTFCRANFKDLHGNLLIEFNVAYFDTIHDETKRNAALQAYPKYVRTAYKHYSKGNVASKWVFISADESICLKFTDGIPMFVNIIPSILDYEEAVEIERERDLEEIRKILVQKIPHLNDGGLLFEPEEAQSMHKAAVKMMSNNNNISVLTTYTDVDAIVSKTTESRSDPLEKMLKNIYQVSGTSAEIFAASGSSSLPTSLRNDLALMMSFANKISKFFTNLINSFFANGNVSFKYEIQPISYYNDIEYIEKGISLASMGYSYILPALASGISQKDLVNLKELENDALKLQEKLIPLNSAYNSSDQGENNGRPKKEDEQKAEKTIKNEKSIEKTNQGASEQ